MPVETGTTQTYTRVGIREDLEDIISNVSPEDKPFQTMIGSKSIKNTFHEWQVDTFRAAATDNAQLEGDAYEYTTPDPTTRVGNHTQIMRESVLVSKTADAVDKAGRSTELAYQVTKKGVELSLDREATLLTNQASTPGDATTARTMGSAIAWCETNALRGTGGTDGGFNSSTRVVDAAGDAAAPDLRTFTRDILDDLLESVYTNSRGQPSYLFMPPPLKRVFSTFTGISELRDKVGGGKAPGQSAIHAGADLYKSDWGTLTVIPDRFMRSRDVIAVNPQFVTRGILRPMNSVTPAETSDANRRVLICEETFICKSEAALGHAADLTNA